MKKKATKQKSRRKDSPRSRAGAGETYERFMAMTPQQRDAEVAPYDREDLTPGQPLTAADKALHRRAQARAKAKMGRPVVGKGAKMVPISIERGLLQEADAFARQRGLKRSQMVAQGLRLLMQK